MNNLLEKVVKCYGKQEGYEVISQPQELPFAIAGYRPDLMVKISETRGLLIELKASVIDLDVSYYRDLSKSIAQDGNWRFLLITDEDATPIAEEDIADQKLTRPQILERKEKIAKLISIGEHEAAFLSLWIFAEVLMRRRARQSFLPIDRLPTKLMIYHLHDQAEISDDQFARAIALTETRNRVAHGFPVDPLNLKNDLERILNLVDEFIAMQA
ncbi:MAG: hypothetical protein AUK48_11760 [Oscillatoriales cyanobacterium CG2_30_44_21]|nr:MAG: hypothetical protein AUK48_11760 [Oscillatoriales cyanobacterium CG2_30_44_21]